MEVDIIFLTKTSNEDYYYMTKEAIESLLNSESDNIFNIIVVESEKNCKFTYNYNKCVTVLFEDEKFNYNRFLQLY